MNKEIIPVYIFSGFLGSGKTTLLNNLINDAKSKGLKPAVILNEVGDVNVEGALVGTDTPLAEILGGCICCSLKGDISTELVQLVQQHRPDVIWIESTGIAMPLELIDGVTEASLYERVALASIVTVVDCRHLLDRVRIGTGKTFRLMKEQIAAADLIVLNKADLVQTLELDELRSYIDIWNPYASSKITVKAQLDMECLVQGQGSNSKRISEHDHKAHHDHDHKAHHEHDHVHSVTYFLNRSIDSQAFELFLKRLPEGIYRAKGIVTFSDTASQFLFQYAYRESDFMRISPQGKVQEVAIFIGENFSKQQLLEQLDQL
ncbi:MAG: GTP-binding protein [Candidatus Cohnella colombiensis]|uniref:GTP-binding protein n=1 Tax=Candidatus Cohnella colombiensis TaxID=3121368 RepID=A0AA95JEA6_9BACL|nr:MAG: GTP-binding protein [Cohnella sp.]